MATPVYNARRERLSLRCIMRRSGYALTLVCKIRVGPDLSALESKNGDRKARAGGGCRVHALSVFCMLYC